MIKEKILFWFNAIFYIVFWCIMMFKPDLALTTIIIAFWLESLLSGIIWVIFAIQDKQSNERWLLAIVAVAQILLWVGLVSFPAAWEAILKVFILLLWIWAIIKWILLTINSFKFKKAELPNWWWILAAGIVLILVWLFLTTNSLLAILIINGVIWLWMTLAGISMIILALQLKRKIRKFEEQVEEALENGDGVEIEITKVRNF